MSIINTSNYFDPLTPQDSAVIAFHHLTTAEKTLTIFLTCLTTLLSLGIATLPTFRALVLHFDSKDEALPFDKEARKADSFSREIFQSTQPTISSEKAISSSRDDPMSCHPEEKNPSKLPTTDQVAKIVHEVDPTTLSSTHQTTTTTTQATDKALPFAPSDYNPDQAILQFVLADFVGGGEGNTLDNAVAFYRHYLTRYCASSCADRHAAEIERRLSFYFSPPYDTPLAETAEEILRRLEADKYIALPGGYYKEGGGHALFYEFFLEEDGSVTLKVCNSGAGLEYHPVDSAHPNAGSIREWRDRTLCFKGATLADLQETQFLEILLSYRRPRPKLNELQDKTTLASATNISDEAVYQALLCGWPGSNEITTENCGGAQRANSCSVQALAKWIKGQYLQTPEDIAQHQIFTFWLKVSALADYLDNNKVHSSQFIADAVRKISNHAAKMQQVEILTAELFDAWNLVAQRAHKAIIDAEATETSNRIATALAFPQDGIDLTQSVPVQRGKLEEQKAAKVVEPYDYPHTLPGEEIPFAELSKLSQEYVAPLMDEMSYRLNFLRLFPICTEFDFDRHVAPHAADMERAVFFNQLGALCYKFFYTKEAATSIHLPDSALADLINGWMIVYFEAKREGQMPPQVLLELLQGVNLLVKSYQNDYIFDSPQSRERFEQVADVCLQEERNLLETLGSDFQPTANLWKIWDRSWDSYLHWLPFGIECNLKDRKPVILSATELPAMARFAYDVLLQHKCGPTDDEWESKWKQLYEGTLSSEERMSIMTFYLDKHKNDIDKVSAAFAYSLPVIPYYDLLREGATFFYFFADRHLGRSRNWNDFVSCERLYPSSTFKPLPFEIFTKERRSTGNDFPGMGSQFDVHTSRPGNAHGLDPHYYPESHLPLTAQKYEPQQDLNQRIGTLIPSVERELPFMSLDEEKEFVAFVQKEPITRLTEAMTFFKKRLPKLAQPDYQSTLEQLLFSMEGSKALEELFTAKDDPAAQAVLQLLFNFIENGYAALLRKPQKIEVAAAFLLHLHLRLVQMGRHYQWSKATAQQELLFEKSQGLIAAGKDNPILGIALAEATLAAMATVEYDKELLEDPRHLQLIVTAQLLGCFPGNFAHSKYSTLALNYGFQVFKAALQRSEDPQTILQKAAQEVFGPEEARSCHWNKESALLQLSNLTIDLAARTIDGGDDTKMRLLPKDISTDYRFQEIFGKRTFLASFKKDHFIERYEFSWRGGRYQIDAKNGSITISKKIGERFYRYSSQNDATSLSRYHCFTKKHLFWGDDQQLFAEDKATGRLGAIGNDEGIHRVKRGKRRDELLSVFPAENDPLKELILRIENDNNTLVWTDKNSKKISRIELPRLQLKFIAQEVNDRQQLQCANFPGFRVATNQHVAFLRSFSNALVLENERGQKKVIVLTKALKERRYQPYIEKPLSGNMNEAQLEVPYIAFDIANELTYPELSASPANVPALTLLLSIYLATKQYQRALNLIDDTGITTKRTLTPTAKALLLEMTSQFNVSVKHLKDEIDNHPHAIALRLRLYAWRHLIQPLKLDYHQEEWLLRKELGLYEDLHHAMGNFKLPRELIDRLQAAVDYKKSWRWHRDIRSKFEYWSQTNIGDLATLSQEIATAYQQPPRPSLSLTTPGEEFLLNFLSNYRIAWQGSPEEKLQLKRLLCLSQGDQEAKIATLNDLLLAVFIAPQSALALEEMVALFADEKEKKDFESALTKHLHAASSAIKGKVESLPELLLGDKKYPMTKGQVKFRSQKSGKHIPINPGEADLTDTFELLPQVAIVPLADPLNIAEIEGALFKESRVDVDCQRKATETFLSWAKCKELENQDDPLMKAQFARLQRGGEQYQEELAKTPPTKALLNQDITKIDSALKRYSDEVTGRETALSLLEKKVLSKGNDLHGNQQVALEILRDQRAAFDIETLLIALGRRDLSAVRNGNPTLSAEEIEALMKQVGEYALKKAELQQLKRASKSLSDYRDLLSAGKLEALQTASDAYEAQARAQRCYRPAEDPHLLIFEVFGDLIIRPEQLEALNSLTSLDGSEIWKLFEARTGFGKSKVLLPLWLLLTAQGDQLAVMTVSAKLFDQQEAYLQKTFKGAYRFFGVRLDFSRESPCSAEDIGDIEAALRRAEKMRLPVFMSDQTAHNLLVLKSKELAQQRSSSDDYAALGALLKLKRYVKEKAVLFVDEPHKVLNDSQETNYSLGKASSFSSERLSFVLRLYTQLFACLEGKFRVEFWSAPTPGAEGLPLLTEELYRREVLPQLLKKMLAYDLKVDNDGLRYLKGEMSLSEQQHYEKGLAKAEGREEHSNNSAIRILHDQLHHYLPQTLKKNSDEHYAMVDPLADRSAIPMEDARNPKQGNEFVFPDQILNFTIQSNLKTPFPKAYVAAYLAKLSNEATEEINNGIENVSETLAYKKFTLLLRGMENPLPSLLKMSPLDLKKIRRQIDRSVTARLQFIGLAVLPEMRRYGEKITSDPHLLVHCFKHCAGAAGTLSLQHLPHQFAITSDEKAIAKTLITLLQKQEELGHQHVVEFSGKKSQDIVGEIFTKLPDASVIIEIGAAMRDYDSLEGIAGDLLSQKAAFDGIASFDSNGVPIVMKPGAKRFISKELTDVADERLLWFYGQKDITGTDQKLPPLARAVVFINEHTTLTELVQGAGRMRALFAGQHVTLALDNNSALLIKQALGKAPTEQLEILDLFVYASRKEGENHGHANFHSLSKQWNALLENRFWDASLAHDTSPQDVAADFQLFRSELTASTEDLPLERVSLSSKPRKIQRALQFQRERFEARRQVMEAKGELAAMASFFEGKFSAASLTSQCQVIQEKMLYPNKILCNGDAEATQVTEATAEQLNQVIATADALLDIHGDATAEQETEATVEATQLWTTWASKLASRKPLPHKNDIQSYPLERLFSHKALMEFLPLFEGIDLQISENGACTFEGDTLKQPGWLNGYVKPLHYIAQGIKGETGSEESDAFTLIDESEAAELLKNKGCRLLWLVNHGVAYASEEQAKDALQQDTQFSRLELAAKLLNGDLKFDDQQWKLFRSWVDGMSSEKIALLDKFIKELLFDLHPLLESSAEYNRASKYIALALGQDY